MPKKRLPLEKLDVEDPEAKAKVSLVLQVLAGDKTISQVCKETGLKPLQYYKVEDRMVQAMLQAAKMPATPGRRRDPIREATSLAQQTEELRAEHRRMQSLVRITKKLFRRGARKPRKNGPGRPKGATPPQAPPTEAEPARRPGRPPQHQPTAV